MTQHVERSGVAPAESLGWTGRASHRSGIDSETLQEGGRLECLIMDMGTSNPAAHPAYVTSAHIEDGASALFPGAKLF